MPSTTGLPLNFRLFSLVYFLSDSYPYASPPFPSSHSPFPLLHLFISFFPSPALLCYVLKRVRVEENMNDLLPSRLKAQID